MDFKEVRKVEVMKVRLRKDGIKYLIVPKKSDIEAGNYVKIIKMEDEDGRRKK